MNKYIDLNQSVQVALENNIDPYELEKLCWEKPSFILVKYFMNTMNLQRRVFTQEERKKIYLHFLKEKLNRNNIETKDIRLIIFKNPPHKSGCHSCEKLKTAYQEWKTRQQKYRKIVTCQQAALLEKTAAQARGKALLEHYR